MADILDASLPASQTTEEGRLFEREVDIVLGGEKKDYPCYIGGLKVGSGNKFYLHSPIDETIIYGSFQEPEEGTMKEAVTAAEKYLKDWASKTAEERAQPFTFYLNGLKARRLHYAALVTVGTGMVREDALNEVDSLIAALEKLISDAKTYKTAKKTGVWAIVSEHNSPLAAPVAYAAGALISGNTVVMNPSNKCPMPIYDFYIAMEKFGLPGGVLNLVVDRKEDASTKELTEDMRLRGVVASGAGDRMEDMMFLQVDDELRFINNLKGMSPAIVYRPGDIKSTARQIVESAFSYSGQRLHSSSKVIVTMDDQQRLLDAIVEIMKDLNVGDPVRDVSFTGPLIDSEAAKRFSDIVMDNAAFVISKAPRCLDSDSRNYVSPVVIMGIDDENDLAYMDSGLPVLDIKVVSGLDEALEELAMTECGLSAGIYSKDAKAISRFKEQADAPVLYINEGSRKLSPVIGLDLGLF